MLNLVTTTRYSILLFKLDILKKKRKNYRSSHNFQTKLQRWMPSLFRHARYVPLPIATRRWRTAIVFRLRSIH